MANERVIQRDFLIEEADRFAVQGNEALQVFVDRLPQKDILTVPEVTAALDLRNSNTVIAWCDSGELPYFNSSTGGKVYRKIPRKSVVALLKSRIH